MKIKSFLTYEGIRWPSDHCLWTKKGVDWLGGLNSSPVDSYLRIIRVLGEEIRVLSNELEGLAEDN